MKNKQTIHIKHLNTLCNELQKKYNLTNEELANSINADKTTIGD